MDIVGQLNETHRETGSRHIPAGDGHTVSMRRSYDASITDVWDACTDPARIARWFLPVSGDLRLGGTYQLEGNAGGSILRCEPPQLLKITWVYGENPTDSDVSEVELRLSAGANGVTVFELEHTEVVDPKRWAEFGPGAVGVGWDLGLLGLSTYLDGGSMEDLASRPASPEYREFVTHSSAAWGAALEASGATAAEAAATVEHTTAFYAP